ncbi:MAG TPA: hypothetical protein VNK96_10310 [Fimbriimonadales bacterium]|nr:hypothetical protein [Fimbriimonadales bacterium]
MINKRIHFAGIAVITVLIVSLTIALAQYGEPGPPKKQPPQEMKMQPPPAMMGPPMGGTAVTSDGSHLFIVSGMHVYKVRKSDLEVEKIVMLPPMHEGMIHKGDMPPPKKKGGDGS